MQGTGLGPTSCPIGEVSGYHHPKPHGKQGAVGLPKPLPPFATIALTGFACAGDLHPHCSHGHAHFGTGTFSVHSEYLGNPPPNLQALRPIVGRQPYNSHECNKPEIANRSRYRNYAGSWTQSPQRRRWQCQAESVDSNETVAAGEQKLSQAKESVTEKQGPPVATIVAGVVVAVVVFWGLWSLISFILGFFFR